MIVGLLLLKFWNMVLLIILLFVFMLMEKYSEFLKFLDLVLGVLYFVVVY